MLGPLTDSVLGRRSVRRFTVGQAVASVGLDDPAVARPVAQGPGPFSPGGRDFCRSPRPLRRQGEAVEQARRRQVRDTEAIAAHEGTAVELRLEPVERLHHLWSASVEEIAGALRRLPDLSTELRNAPPKLKRQVCEAFGLRVIYDKLRAEDRDLGHGV